MGLLNPELQHHRPVLHTHPGRPTLSKFNPHSRRHVRSAISRHHSRHHTPSAAISRHQPPSAAISRHQPPSAVPPPSHTLISSFDNDLSVFAPWRGIRAFCCWVGALVAFVPTGEPSQIWQLYPHPKCIPSRPTCIHSVSHPIPSGFRPIWIPFHPRPIPLPIPLPSCRIPLPSCPTPSCPTGDESYRTSSRPARPISSRSIAPAEGTPSTSAIPSATTSATTSAILHHQDSHALAASSAPSLSPTIAIGFWTVGTSLTPLPPPRAADGGAVLRPLPIFAMRRGTYAFR